MNVVNPDALAIITIWQEASGESYKGKVAVGEVIRNRMLRNYSSDGTVAGTVARPWQFSGWEDRAYLIRALKLNDMDPVVQDCIRAWNQSRDTNFAKGAVLYCNLSVLPERPSWAREDRKVVKIAAHTFFSD